MWLLPAFPSIARAAGFIYYRVRYAGEHVPQDGPVLLVSNHPNSLLDPMLVVAAARRPVRFLAKAPLFSDPFIGWLVKATGAIPVYRRQDDPAQMERNLDAFRAVYDALGRGAAVGIFPEGVSHSEPSLVPLKTGAARIALGALASTGAPFPIVPVGLVFRQKDVFRSEVIVYTGRPVEWDDLAAVPPSGTGSREETSDAETRRTEAVRMLTERISAALRQVTLNLAQWEDRPLVECAVKIWETERGVPSTAAERVTRLEVTTRVLAEVRGSEDPVALALARDVELFCRRLQRLRLRPADLVADVRLSRGVRWAAARLHLLVPVAALVAVAATVLFWAPYRAVGAIVSRLDLEEDLRSTWKLLLGGAVYLLWILALASLAGARYGLWPALGVLSGVPVTGVIGLLIRERWRWARNDAGRFLLLRSRRELVAALRARQRELGQRIDALYNAFTSDGRLRSTPSRVKAGT